MQDYEKTEYWQMVQEFIKELKTAKYWFKNDGKPKKEWKLFETKGAAWNAARDAAYYAAWNAAWNAARDAAWNAARDAAYYAAYYAARDAARNATREAAWDAAVFAEMLCCIGLKIEICHLLHLNARMEVWRKGYGLLCDVDGVLYVYKRIR